MRMPMSGIILLSLLWALLGLLLALANPWLWLLSAGFQEAVNAGALVVTGALIVWNAAVSVALVGRTGRTLTVLPLTVVQLVLFTLLFFQIAAHRGADHYSWEQLPGVWDWLWFAGAHAVKAGDVCDIIEAYGWNIQTINHASHLTGLSLIAFHLVMGVFLISLVEEGARRLQGVLPRGVRSVPRIPRLTLGLGLLLVAGWLVSALWLRPWKPHDLLWWPIDNLLRVADFVDALEIYDVRLHSVPKVGWEATLTALFRVFLSMILAGLLGWITREIRVRWLFGWGLNERELHEAHGSHPSPAVRIRLQRKLAAVRSALAVDLKAAWLVLASGLVILTLVGVLLDSRQAWPRWPNAAVSLAEAACDPSHPQTDQARRSLCRMGSYGQAAVPIISQSLPAAPRQTQLALVDTLGFLGPTACTALGGWIGVTDEEVALRGVLALGRIGPCAAPQVASALEPGCPRRVREAAREILRQQGDKAVRALIEALTQENAASWIPILDELTPYWSLYTSRNEFFMEARNLPSCLNKVTRGSPREIEEAAKTLPKLGSAARPAVPPLVNRLDDKDKDVRRAAALALGRLGPAADAAAPPLIKCLDDNDKDTRRAAAEALGWVGSAVAVPALIKCLHDKDKDVCYSAAAALGKIGPPAASAVPALVTHLTSSDIGMRYAAASALGKMGRAAAPAMYALFGCLHSNDSGLAQAGAESLAKIGPPVVPILVQELAKRGVDDSSANLRSAAVEILAKIGPDASAALPALVLCLADSSSQVRSVAATALLEIDSSWASTPAVRQAIPALIKLLGGGSGGVRAAAEETLMKIDSGWAGLPAARQAVPDFVKLLGDSDGDVRAAAEETLMKIGRSWANSPAARQAVPALVDQLKDSARWMDLARTRSPLVQSMLRQYNDRLRQAGPGEDLREKGLMNSPEMRQLEEIMKRCRQWCATAEALGKIGPGSDAATPLLIQRLADKESDVRSTAARALEKIDRSWATSSAARQAMPALVLSLADLQSYEPVAAAEVLAKIDKDWPRSPAVRQAVPALLKRLQDSRMSMHFKVGSKDGQADPHLKEWCAAAEALGKIGPAAAAAAPTLVASLLDSNEQVRSVAAAALKRIDKSWTGSPAGRQPVPPLIRP